MTPILPGATFGVLGGGQLGRYALMAARTMGYRTAVLDPDPHAPAKAIADIRVDAAFDDETALAALATEADVVTIEFENPPAAALDYLAARTRVAPSPRAVAIAQDRIREKQFLVESGFPVAPFAVIDVPDADPLVTYPAILKTARLGYDGKGQRTVEDGSAMRAAWRLLGSVPCVLEQALALETEVSVVAGRFVALYVQAGLPRVRVFGLDGRLEREVTLPQLGTTFTGFTGLRSHAEAFTNVNSVAHPGAPYRFDPATGAFTPFRRLKLAFEARRMSGIL